MTRKEALELAMQACEKTWNEKTCKKIRKALEQETKTGHWKRISMDLYVQHATAYYQCSECGEKVIGEHNYCQFCGARMESEEE